MYGAVCLVTGKVQGVHYRASAQNEARRLGLVGHARNLPDGGVEVLACGERAAVERLVAWLWKGPPMALVTEVSVSIVELTDPPGGFTTG